jgi:hypothetical protein
VPPLKWITCSVVGAKMLWRRLTQWTRPTESGTAEYALLREIVNVALTFRPEAVHENERIPTLKPQVNVSVGSDGA